MSPQVAARLSMLFFVFGPGLEAGLGPFLLTGGWHRGDDLPGQELLTAVGSVVVAAGLVVVAGAFARFARDGRGSPTPAAPTGRLVVTGAYRHVRNPMYLATAAMIAGQGLALARPVLFVAAAAYVTTLAVATRRWEEPALLARFGRDYAEYRRAVPGWWPRRDPWTPAAAEPDGLERDGLSTGG